MMTLEHTRDNKTRAAEILGISLKTLHNKLNKLRLRPKKTNRVGLTAPHRAARPSPSHAPRHQRQAGPRRHVDRRRGRRRAEPAAPGAAGAASASTRAARAPSCWPTRSTTARARSSVDGADPLRRRCAPIPGLRSILESSLYSKNVTFAAIVDVERRRRRARRSGARRAAAAAPAATSTRCWRGRRSAQLRAIYSGQGRNLEFAQPLLLGDTRVRIDPHRRLDAADPRAISTRRCGRPR